ncbi:MAG: epoxyqueuosine reductase QueH [Lachnospiraceae bacterium]|nr:epoxyqueuosine reductase QueH [Lachnospiraceae bacterium]
MNQPNYQKELDRILKQLAEQEADFSQDENIPLKKAAPTLFLHSCCAPCSSYVLKYLREYFRITVFYYNPNISMQEEYRKRVEEQKRLIAAYNAEAEAQSDDSRNVAAEEQSKREHVEDSGSPYRIDIVEGDYKPEVFLELTKEYADCPEGRERCFLCYELRLRRTAEEAKRGGFDYFCTTLSISPLKNAAKINEIGSRLEQEIRIKWLPSDFKKKDGYKQSVELSRIYDLYRQDYCGCAYSKAERMEK